MYQVLYRKYRPQVFSDVVGQDHITRTLQQELQSGKLSHAYLFTGSRGTGKTTCAKILAKAVNCLHPVDGNPCNECEVCRGIDSGAILDVVEIDAASNNGVDNIRDIRDEANFAPVNCRYRVYIIDEVHMLSIGAFNALLKTLEEPPAHVKFILATTEVHKLPVTILSRCQRFDFHRVSPEAMLARMQTVAAQEGFTLDADAGMLIARLADGGMRDALSTLDQCIGRSRHVTAQLVTDVAGITGKDHLFRLADAIAAHDAAAAIEQLSDLHAKSVDMERLCADLVQHFRNLMIVKTVRRADNVLICTADELAQYRAQGTSFTLETLLYAIDLLQETAVTMKKGVNRRIEMELALLRLANPSLSSDNKAVLSRVSAVERAVRSGVTPQPAPQPAPIAPPVLEPEEPEAVAPPEEAPAFDEEDEPLPEETAQPELFPPEELPAEEQAPEEADEAPLPEPPPEPTPEPTPPRAPDVTDDETFGAWPQVLSELSQINMPMWGVLTGSTAFERGDFILIKSENDTVSSFIRSGTNARDVKEAIARVTGRKYRLGIYSNPVTQQKAEEKQDPLAGLLQKAQQLGVLQE
ncbi:MAG: DNA polymerase III subunit gamma/tau [Clostridia bacterium]|nr:DNA polymerase III subunit gamma/tau [Clostridia bacterium]